MEPMGLFDTKQVKRITVSWPQVFPVTPEIKNKETLCFPTIRLSTPNQKRAKEVRTLNPKP